MCGPVALEKDENARLIDNFVAKGYMPLVEFSQTARQTGKTVPPAATPPSPSVTLHVSDLAIARGGRTLARGISFTLRDGEGLIVRGPNGAGKSTLLRVLAGLLAPAAGEIRLDGCGQDDAPGPNAHYLGHAHAMKNALTAGENLAFWRSFCGAPALEPLEALEKTGLAHVIDVPFGWLSAGQKRRAAFARLLTARRPLWLLDEPTSALDARSSQTAAALMSEHLASGGLLVAATHLPLDVPGVSFLDMGIAP